MRPLLVLEETDIPSSNGYAICQRFGVLAALKKLREVVLELNLGTRNSNAQRS